MQMIDLIFFQYKVKLLLCYCTLLGSDTAVSHNILTFFVACNDVLHALNFKYVCLACIIFEFETHELEIIKKLPPLLKYKCWDSSVADLSSC